jgi:hypothetical protein
MSKCFIIQPFDDGKFDKRFKDTYEPALKECGVEAYRVDQDINSVIPIEDIDTHIRDSDLCLADITTDNPNVWFELGLAIAYNDRSVILICSTERTTKFPFDVQHRAIIQYSTEAPSDFEALKQQIILKTKALLQMATAKNISNKKSPHLVENLDSYEISILTAIATNTDNPKDGVSAWTIKDGIEKDGFTKMAFTLGVTKLMGIDFLISNIDSDQNGNDYSCYSLTDKGMQWLMDNKENLILEKHPAPSQKNVTGAVLTYEPLF